MTPEVTVVIPTHNGLSLLQKCLPSVLATDYPRLKVLVVDNGSTDGTPDEVPSRFPGIHVLSLGSNTGFARACNRGAASVHSPYVAFLNNDMKVDSAWLSPLVEALEESPTRIAAGSKVLSWDGSRVDFAGGDINFEGRAFQRLFGAPSSQCPSTPSPTAFANGGAMLVRREAFLRIGGFDEDFFAYYEDVDFGWRAWVLGFELWWVPRSVTYHLHSATASRLTKAHKRFLLERNALLSMYKNYEEATLHKALACALFLAATRTVAGAQLHRPSYLMWPPAPPQDQVWLSPEAGAHLAAVTSAIGLLPSMKPRRSFIQAHRVRTDREVWEYLGKPFEPISPGRTYGQVQHTLLRTTGLGEVLKGRTRVVLVISPDVLPLPGLPTTGAGLRAWGIGQGLRARGFQVRFSMPKAALAAYPQVPEDIKALAWDEQGMQAVVQASEADVVVACGWPLLEHLAECPKPIALDFHGPHLLERTIQRHLDLETNIQTKLACIARADFYTCAGDRQRSYFIPWLLMAGVPYSEAMISQVPVCLSPALPTPSPPEDEVVFVYGGVFLPWQDPSVALTVLVEEMEREGRGRLELFGGRHPFIPLDTRRFEELVRRLERSPRVRVHGMVDHDTLLATYQKASVAMDVMAQNPERELAFTTRTVEYLWCGLPVIYHDYADLSSLIHRFDAGWVVSPSDPAQIRAAVRQALTEPAVRAAKAANAHRLVRERLTWDKAVEPLARFCQDPSFRPKTSPTLAWSAAVELAALRRAVYDKDVHIRNLEAMLARSSWSRMVRYYWGRARFHYTQGGLRRVVSQGVDKLRLATGRRAQ